MSPCKNATELLLRFPQKVCVNFQAEKGRKLAGRTPSWGISLAFNEPFAQLDSGRFHLPPVLSLLITS
eukprot:s900_g9.t1